jgi:trehalose 6-phosphate phosphatase
MIVPPPTPNSALNAPASVPIAASRKSLGDMAGILRTVPAPTAETLAAALRPVTEDPARAAVLCDIDGTLAPIVMRAEEAHVPDKVSRLLGRAARRYALVACISGRSAADARRIVGVGGIAYAGSHGAELLEPGATRARISPAFESWTDRVADFVASRDDRELRRLRVRIERKGPIAAFHWRGVPDEDAARTRLEGIAQEAEAAGLDFHWGRKVLEIRPPVPVDKGQAVRELVERSGVRTALFGGDDATDLDAFAALDALVAEGALDAAVKVGVHSAEGPPAIGDQADQVVDGTDGFVAVLEALAGE